MDLVLLNPDVAVMNPIDLLPIEIIAQSINIWGFVAVGVVIPTQCVEHLV